MASAAAQTIPWFNGRSFESYRDEFDRRGYLVFERVLVAGYAWPPSAPRWRRIWRAISRAATILRAKGPTASMR